MLRIQGQPQVSYNNSSVSFNGRRNEETRPWDNDETDSFDMSEEENNYDKKDALESEKRKTKADADEAKRGFDDLADNLENSDSKVAKKMGKGARILATGVGLAGTFAVAKVSSKLAIETLKSAVKSDALKSTMKSFESLKEPAKKTYEAAKKAFSEIAEKPAVKEKLTAFKDSKIGKKVDSFLANEKVQKVVEPIKNTISSIKDIKINGKKIQTTVENTMAVTTTGSVLVDNLTGRNNNKSNLELATGSSGEV